MDDLKSSRAGGQVANGLYRKVYLNFKEISGSAFFKEIMKSTKSALKSFDEKEIYVRKGKKNDNAPVDSKNRSSSELCADHLSPNHGRSH